MDASEPLFLNLQILNVYQIHDFQLGIFCHKYVNSKLPKIFNESILRVSDVHNYPTRSSSLFYLPRTHTKYGENSFKYLAPKLWNAIPPKLRTILFMNTFKKELKAFILTK